MPHGKSPSTFISGAWRVAGSLSGWSVNAGPVGFGITGIANNSMEARLIPLDQLAGIAALPLTKPETTIGRHSNRDILLDDGRVSGLHAINRLVDGAYVIEDQGSLHGTKVNGQLIKSHRLANN